MKKITYLLAIALVSSVSFAQSNLVTAKEMGDPTAPTIDYGNDTSNLAACSQQTPSNGIENGFGYITELIFADDFVVQEGETMSVEKVNFTFLLPPGTDVEEADIYFYEDSGNGPGVELYSLMLIEPSNVEPAGTNFGFMALDAEFTFDTPLVFNGSDSGETIYWVGVQAAAFADGFIEVTSIVNTPNPLYYFDDGENRWVSSAEPDEDEGGIGYGAAHDMIMTVTGDCNVLGVDNNALSQVSVYPNPTSGILNLQTPSNVDVSSVALFDVLGKKVNADYNNSTINMSGLSQGIYLLKVETSAGTLTQKIVKQ